MFRFRTEDLVNTWQLISVNVNRQRSADLFYRGTTSATCSHARTCSCLFLHPRNEFLRCHQLDTAWTCVMVANWGSQRCWFRKQFCTIKRSWRFEGRCAAILLGTTLVMAGDAPNSSESMEMHEAFISSVLEFCGKDVVVGPETSTLQEISMWNWV